MSKMKAMTLEEAVDPYAANHLSVAGKMILNADVG